jgi:hypothetical protein
VAKSKKVQIAESAKRAKDTQVQLDIEERLAGCGRKEAEHIIYVGNLVERALKGEIGAVIKALTVGRTSSELSASRTMNVPSERVLGRLEMADSLWGDFEQFVHDKDRLMKPSEENQEGIHAYNYGPD